MRKVITNDTHTFSFWGTPQDDYMISDFIKQFDRGPGITAIGGGGDDFIFTGNNNRSDHIYGDDPDPNFVLPNGQHPHTVGGPPGDDELHVGPGDWAKPGGGHNVVQLHGGATAGYALDWAVKAWLEPDHDTLIMAGDLDVASFKAHTIVDPHHGGARLAVIDSVTLVGDDNSPVTDGQVCKVILTGLPNVPHHQTVIPLLGRETVSHAVDMWIHDAQIAGHQAHDALGGGADHWLV